MCVFTVAVDTQSAGDLLVVETFGDQHQDSVSAWSARRAPRPPPARLRARAVTAAPATVAGHSATVPRPREHTCARHVRSRHRPRPWSGTPGACPQRGEQRLVVRVGGEHHDLGPGELGPDPPVASTPSQRGILRSIRTTSGASSPTSRTASSPSPAAPTTSTPGSRPSSITMPSRTTVWSSATTTRAGFLSPPSPSYGHLSVTTNPSLVRTRVQRTAQQFGALAHAQQTVLRCRLRRVRPAVRPSPGRPASLRARCRRAVRPLWRSRACLRTSRQRLRATRRTA